MPKKLDLLREEITYSQAQSREVNVLHQLTLFPAQVKYFEHLSTKFQWFRSVVAHHLGLSSPEACRIGQFKEWFHGSFNVCIPIEVHDWKSRRQPGTRVMMRLPLPHRVGEAFRPGNGDEKLRCEAATYVWLQENCPEVPIPRLYGFGWSTGETFTRIEQLPFFRRCFEQLRFKWLSLLRRPLPSPYVRHQTHKSIGDDRADGGYLLIEYIEQSQGEMLSKTWPEKKKDSTLLRNFFRDLSRIMLRVSRIAMPRIGSWMMDNDGYIHLANRPLSCELQDLEAQKIPTNIPRDYTYTTTDSYVVDMLGCHDSRIQNQPNVSNDLNDCAYQMASISAMRTLLPAYFQRKYRRGPFVFSLTDQHNSNIFVDKDWHITCLVDLEWACVLPIEMVGPPHWLTNSAVDCIDSEEYGQMRAEFMDALTSEEKCLFGSDNPIHYGEYATDLRLSTVMNEGWEIGTFWYQMALTSPTGLFAVFDHHVQPTLGERVDSVDDYALALSYLWGRHVFKVMAQKRDDKAQYDIDLKRAFADDEEEKTKLSEAGEDKDKGDMGASDDDLGATEDSHEEGHLSA